MSLNPGKNQEYKGTNMGFVFFSKDLEMSESKYSQQDIRYSMLSIRT